MVQVILAAHEIVLPSTMLAKISILLLYRRIFAVKRYMSICVLLGTAVAVLTYIPGFVVTPIFCAPRGDEPSGATVVGRCGALRPWTLLYSIIVIALDLFIFILPLPTIFHLLISRKKRLGIALIFATGAS